jgi:hypothetical protein
MPVMTEMIKEPYPHASLLGLRIHSGWQRSIRITLDDLATIDQDHSRLGHTLEGVYGSWSTGVSPSATCLL